jgi:hypothetical protein
MNSIKLIQMISLKYMMNINEFIPDDIKVQKIF